MPKSFREQFESAFAAARYTVEFADGSRTFRVGEQVLGVERFGIVTAWNPPGEQRTPDENAAANARLLERIATQGWRHRPSLASAPEGNHAEPGFAVFGAPPEAVLLLAREFEQAAIAWFDGQYLRILWTDEAG